MTSRNSLLAALLVFAIGAAACTDAAPAEPTVAPSTTVATTTSAPTATTAVPVTTTTASVGPEPTPALSPWIDGRATLTVPLDRNDPNGLTIEVPVTAKQENHKILAYPKVGEPLTATVEVVRKAG